MAQVRLPSGELVNLDDKGNILNPDNSVFTGGGATPPNVDIGVGGRGEANLTDEQSKQVAEASSRGLAASEYGNFLSDPNFSFVDKNGLKINSPLATSNKSINRPYTQNSLVGADTSSSGLNSDGYLGGETDAQKKAREYLDEFKTPETRDQILERKTKEASSRIQANKDYFASLLGEQKNINDLRSRETNARAVLSGLSGSTEAGTMAVDTAEKNTKSNQRILAQQAVELENIYKDIQDSVDQDLAEQKNEAYTKAGNIVARQEQNRVKAVNNITLLSKSGFDFNNIKLNDPVTYKHLADQVGGEEVLNAISVLNRPQEQVIDKKIENGKYVIAFQNPLTGKTRIESVDLGIPQQYTKSVDLGDKIMFVPDNFNPAVDKPIYYNKGLTPNQSKPSNPSTPNTNKITLSEAKANKLPMYVVGMSEAEITNSLYDEEPPKWFREKVSQETKTSVLPQVLKEEWTKFRDQILNTVSGSSSNTNQADELTNPF